MFFWLYNDANSQFDISCNGYLFNVVNCQKSRKKCDDKRPCQRCIDLNITETCKDSARKARRATKRGPYKHRV